MSMQIGAQRTNAAYITVLKWLRRPNRRAFLTTMENDMRTWTNTCLAAALAASVGLGSSLALAEGGSHCDGGHEGRHGMTQRMDPAAMTERADERLAKLEQTLVLKPAQRATWDEFRAVMRGNAQKAAEHMRAMRTSEQPATALERMARMEAFGRERLDSMQQMRKASEALYSKLDDAQKKTFDEQFRLFGPHGRGGNGPHHPGKDKAPASTS
jgi:hypothetical protein